MRALIFAAMTATAIAAASPVAAAFPTGSGPGAQPTPEPAPAKTVNIGDYCASTYAPTTTVAHTATGQAVYCVRVRGTDAYVWWTVDHILPVDPHYIVSAGDYCLAEGDMWADEQGRKMFCQPNSSGQLAWRLAR